MQRIASFPLAVALALTATLAVSAEDAWSPYRPFSPAPRPPEVDAQDWRDNPVDAFVYARLKQAQLPPAPAIGRRAWIRRVTYDLIGLPPTPEELRDFLSDSRSDAPAFEAVVDRLLASPRYGERWARHWLDVVRYADTDGFAIDEERPTMWRYRDYVIRALNEDRPVDRFIREQLAGDTLDAGSDGVIATSFYRLGPYEADNMVPENRRQDFLNEMTIAVGDAFLGLTVGCARCHDHKYDPIPQSDFYRLQAFLTPLARAEVPAEFVPGELSGSTLRQKADLDAEFAERRAALDSLRNALKAKLAKAGGKTVEEITDEQLKQAVRDNNDALTDEDRKRIKELQKKFKDDKRLQRLRAVAAGLGPVGKEAPATHVLRNGDPFNPGDPVQPGYLSIAEDWASDYLEQAGRAAPVERRRWLARWVADSRNPLTARVLVNRVWQHHMGQGIVATSNDFGTNGSGASHPELLDFLADWFVDQGWRLKRLHRMLVLSRTYRTSSIHPGAEQCARIDAENRLLWRANIRRLEAETLRDAMLAVSGRLNLRMGGPGFYEALPEGMESSYPFFQWNPSPENERRRRSIYMFQRRNLVHPMMEVFDVADLNQSCERRKASVTAPQVLSQFNGRFAHETGRHLARRVQREGGDDLPAQVDRLFWLALSRPPDVDEFDRCIGFLREKSRAYATENDRALAALSDLCLVLINTNEFMYLD